MTDTNSTVTINDAKVSKINWTAAATAGIALATAFGLNLDDHQKVLILEAVSTLGPVAIIIFRTFMTKKPVK